MTLHIEQDKQPSSEGEGERLTAASIPSAAESRRTPPAEQALGKRQAAHPARGESRTAWTAFHQPLWGRSEQGALPEAGVGSSAKGELQDEAVAQQAPLRPVKREAVVAPRSTVQGADPLLCLRASRRGPCQLPSPRSLSPPSEAVEEAHTLPARASTPGTCGCRPRLWSSGGLQGVGHFESMARELERDSGALNSQQHRALGKTTSGERRVRREKPSGEWKRAAF